MNDTLSNALSKILNAERIGRSSCEIRPSSKVIKRALTLMNDSLYIGSFKEVKDGRGNVLQINLIGMVNKCGAIKPRWSVKKDEFEKFEKRYLPAKGFGILIVSTVNGIMTHTEAKEKGLGGKLIAYVY